MPKRWVPMDKLMTLISTDLTLMEEICPRSRRAIALQTITARTVQMCQIRNLFVQVI